MCCAPCILPYASSVSEDVLTVWKTSTVTLKNCEDSKEKTTSVKMIKVVIPWLVSRNANELFIFLKTVFLCSLLDYIKKAAIVLRRPWEASEQRILVIHFLSLTYTVFFPVLMTQEQVEKNVLKMQDSLFKIKIIWATSGKEFCLDQFCCEFLIYFLSSVVLKLILSWLPHF